MVSWWEVPESLDNCAYTYIYIYRSELLHPPFDSCNYTFIERFYRVFRNMLPVYTSLHLVPMLLLRTKHFLKA